MKNITEDALAFVIFFPSENGGRKGPTPREYFKCIITIDNINFDVRLNLIESGAIWPGSSTKVLVKFLDITVAKKHFKIGSEFLMREVTIFGYGNILECYWIN